MDGDLNVACKRWLRGVRVKVGLDGARKSFQCVKIEILQQGWEGVLGALAHNVYFIFLIRS